MNSISHYAADEPVRTVVLDALSWRDIALGAVLTLLLVLSCIALAVVRDKRRRRGSGRREGVIDQTRSTNHR